MALHFLYYNFVAIRQTLRTTPASPAPSGEPSSGIGKLVSLADTFAKLGVGVIALYGAYYLFITEETKQCNPIQMMPSNVLYR